MGSFAPISISSAGDTTIIDNTKLLDSGAPVALEILAIGLVTAADVNLTFKNGTTALTGPMPLREMLLERGAYPHFTVSPGQDFVITASAAIVVGGWVEYTVKSGV